MNDFTAGDRVSFRTIARRDARHERSSERRRRITLFGPTIATSRYSCCLGGSLHPLFEEPLIVIGEV